MVAVSSKKYSAELWIFTDLTEERVHEAADAPHGSEEDLRQLFEAGVLNDLVRNAVSPQQLLLKLRGGTHYDGIAQVHRVTEGERDNWTTCVSIHDQNGSNSKWSLILFQIKCFWRGNQPIKNTDNIRTKSALLQTWACVESDTTSEPHSRCPSQRGWGWRLPLAL